MFTEEDKMTLKSAGRDEKTVEAQLKRFETGFPYLRLAGSANVGNGIVRLSVDEEGKAIDRWERYLKDGGKVTKFVPASGAASRMFKSLFAFVNGDADVPAPGSDVEALIENIDKMPFVSELDETLRRLTGKTTAELKKEGRFKELVSAIVNPEGMNYGGLPKGLLSFHRYTADDVRTPVEEQMIEGAQTAASDGDVRLHFTVSGAHRELFNRKIDEVKPRLEKKYNVRYDVSLSEQQPSTDTIAANPDNTPFRDERGALVFRPGGHGALIANLSDLDSDVVFIKNIDNVVPDSERESTIRYKKILAGTLILAHDKIEKYLLILSKGTPEKAELKEMAEFLENELFTRSEGFESLNDDEKAAYLRTKFDRPLRVCGMVVNEGEPGGGPYVAYNKDGSISPQILESTQINTSDPDSMAMMAQAKYFNPVDLVCYITRLDGTPYRLTDYVDPDTGFISSKSAGGRDLKALELPGLWNGAMSDWSTIFAEVPASTFNPVKTVNDLLRPVHQADK